MELEGLPQHLVAADLGEGNVTVRLHEEVYPLDVVYQAAFTFIDRYYVLLDKVTPGHLEVVLSPKSGALDEQAARRAAGELAAELLACAWRQQIVRENRSVIEAVTMRALGGAMGPPSLDDLANFDFGQEEFDDPLGIAVSWEEKYKKKKDEPSAEKAPEGEVKDS